MLVFIDLKGVSVILKGFHLDSNKSFYNGPALKMFSEHFLNPAAFTNTPKQIRLICVKSLRGVPDDYYVRACWVASLL